MRTIRSRHQFLQLEAQYIESPCTIYEFRAGFSRVGNAELHEVRDSVPASLSFVNGQPLGLIQVIGLTDLGGNRARLRPRRNPINDFQFGRDLA